MPDGQLERRHERTCSGTGGYLKAEIERIVGSLHTLNDLNSKVHNPVTKQDARLAAIGTYTILGEFIARTDMQPVGNYDATEGKAAE